jgi:hypothetical protein
MILLFRFISQIKSKLIKYFDTHCCQFVKRHKSDHYLIARRGYLPEGDQRQAPAPFGTRRSLYLVVVIAAHCLLGPFRQCHHRQSIPWGPPLPEDPMEPCRSREARQPQVARQCQFVPVLDRRLLLERGLGSSGRRLRDPCKCTYQDERPRPWFHLLPSRTKLTPGVASFSEV